MKSIFISVFFALPYLSFSNTTLKLGNDSVQIVLSMAKHRIKKDTDLYIYVSVSSIQKRILQIPKGDNMAYIDQGSSFYLLQCQKKINSKFVDLPGVASLDNIPQIKLDTLHANEFHNT